ncbi:MAG: hypothetical protein WC668_02010 [Patescibacteria group bacterium]|jgi:hypothetical protein
MFFREKRLKKWAENNGYTFRSSKDEKFKGCYAFNANDINITGNRNGKSFEIIEKVNLSFGGFEIESTSRENEIRVNSKKVYPKPESWLPNFFNDGVLTTKQIENLLDEYIKNGKIDYKKYLTVQQKVSLIIILPFSALILFEFIKVIFF